MKKTKGWVDEKIVGKFREAPTHLKPVIKLAVKDATMLFAACLLGKITSESVICRGCSKRKSCATTNYDGLPSGNAKPTISNRSSTSASKLAATAAEAT